MKKLIVVLLVAVFFAAPAYAEIVWVMGDDGKMQQMYLNDSNDTMLDDKGKTYWNHKDDDGSWVMDGEGNYRGRINQDNGKDRRRY